MSKKILIVVVLYKTDLNDSTTFKSLQQSRIKEDQAIDFRFFIWDNAPRPSNLPDFTSHHIVEYLSTDENSGISKAYNTAAKYAKEHDYDWLLLADQDTFFPEHILNTYCEAIRDFPDVKLFLPKVKISSNDNMYMSPVKKNHYFTKLSPRVPVGIINPIDYGIINSGIMVHTQAFLNVGGYDEKVWLDFSDFQFIERFSKPYDKACVIDEACIQSFSYEVSDTAQKITRFKIFCKSVKHFKPTKWFDRICVFGVVLKRTLSLCKQSGKLEPISIFVKDYLF